MLLPLLLLPALVAAQTSPGPTMCCPVKQVNSTNYIFVENSNETKSYNCVDDCVYHLENTDERFCFAPGDEDVKCIEEKANCVYCQCGNANLKNSVKNRIVGGNPAPTIPATGQTAYPWQVYLYDELVGIPGGQAKVICGGTIIGNKKILTAAQCMTGLGVTLYARIGAYTTGAGTLYSGTAVEVIEQVAIDKYLPRDSDDPRWGSAEYDVAVLTVAEDLLTPAFGGELICLPAKDEVVEGKDAKAVGWGNISGPIWGPGKPTESGITLSPPGNQSPILQEVELKTITNAECKATGYGQVDGVINDSTLCAISSDEETRAACNGDFGGPLVIKKLIDLPFRPSALVFVQIGVTSFGWNGCGVDPEYPGVSAKLTNPDILQFIYEQLEKE